MLEDYLKLCIENKYHNDLIWLQTVLGKIIKPNKYLNGTVYTVGEKEFTFKTSPLISSDTIISLEIEGKKRTITAFKYIAYILYILPFNGKIPFQEGSYTYITLFKKYIVKDLIKADANSITLEEYKNFMKAIVFTHALSTLIVHTSTEKTITPAKGIKEYKAKLIKEVISKYGKDALKDEFKMLEVDTKLKDFDKKYMEDDPTMGIVTSKKIMNVSRKSKFISIGKPTALIDSTETGYITESLSDGTPLNAKKIMDINNAIRYGSAARGMETQLTGLIAKYLSAATRAFSIKEDDCKTKNGYKINITEDNISYINGIRYDIKGNLINASMGASLVMRDYMYCETEGNGFCKICVGKVASEVYNPAILLSITTGGKGLQGSLSKFHAVVKDLTELDSEDMFK